MADFESGEEGLTPSDGEKRDEGRGEREYGSSRPIAGRTVSMANAGFTKADSGGTRIAKDECDNEMYFVAEKVDFIGRNGIHFVIDLSRELGRGGEAVVVVALNDSEEEFAAKVYSLTQGRREKRNHDKVLGFLSEISSESAESYKTTHLMPLIEYGTVSATLVGEERPGEFSVSIMPKCKCLGDDLVPRADIKRRIIPGLAEALKTLHAQNIVHRDVKPSNVYEYNGTVVLGDYGISTVLDEGDDTGDTRSSRGTPGYYYSFGYFKTTGDWYSLGYTIWTMYNDNVHPHQNLIAAKRLGKVYAGQRVVPFEPRSEEDASLRDLVYGLTTVNDERRLGYEDVRRWIEDPDGFEFEDPDSDETEGWRHRYEFGGVKYGNGAELAKALSNDWDWAIQHLFDGNDLVEHFSRNGENDVSTKLRVIVREQAGAGQDLGIAQAIYIISGTDERMSWKGRDVSWSKLFSDFASKPIEDLEPYDSLFQSGFLTWALRERGSDSVGFDIGAVEVVQDVSSTNPRFARSLFQHLFAEGGVSEYAGYEDPKDLIEKTLENPQELYSIAGDEDSLEKFRFFPFSCGINAEHEKNL